MCTSLAKHNYNVSLIVADGKDNEIKNNVNIYDVGLPKSRLDRIRKAPQRLLAKAIALNTTDIYHLHDPELIFIGLTLKKHNKKVIFDIHEMTRLQILSKAWIPSFLRKPIAYIYSAIENFSCKKFNHLITPQEEMTSYFSKLSKTSTIYNYPEHNFCFNRTYSSRFNLIYAGGISKERGLINCINLIEDLIKIDSRYRLTMACPKTEELIALVEKSNAKSNIDLVGYIKFDDLIKLYDKSALGLILFNNIGQYYMSNALKLFEYMGAGLVIIMPNFGDWVTFNKKNNVGYNLETTNSHQIAQKIHNLPIEQIEYISLSNHQLVKENFSWETQEEKLINIYKDVFYE